MTFHAYAAHQAKAPLAPFDYEPQPLRSGDVEIAITHCGICHSDVHIVDGDWGEVFPAVPGHEIVGTVTAGDAFSPGQRVGVGWQRDSCGECRYCEEGEEELCAGNQATCLGHFGGFADRIRVNGRFALPIPESMESGTAAPLLCGGVTVWSPLRRHAGPGSRVGVIGIGGLGHLALQFAGAMGCEVTAFSRSADKEEAAREFGAHHFVTGAPARGSLDLVLNTAHAAPEFEAFMAGLAPRGVYCQLGAAPEPLVVPAMALIGGRRTVCGSAIGSPGAIAEMLGFAAEHGIAARTEPMAMERANEAMDRTRRNLARYRMVLVR